MTTNESVEAPPVIADVHPQQSPGGGSQTPSTALHAQAALLLASGCAFVALAGVAAPWLWLGELAVHWSGHAALGLLPALVIWRRRPRYAVVLTLLTMIAVIPGIRSLVEPRLPAVAPVAPAAPVEIGQTASLPITVAFANAYDFNRERTTAMHTIAALTADVVGLAEVSAQDRPLLAVTRWPFQHWEDRAGTLSVALLSAYPIISTTLHDAHGAGILEAAIDLGQEHPLRVIVAHLCSPKNVTRETLRNGQLQMLVDLATVDGKPLLLMGDLNISSSSPHWRTFIRGSGLRRAPGLSPATWPAVLGPGGIGIDHLLARNLGLTTAQPFSLPGSDHRGLRATAWLRTEGKD